MRAGRFATALKIALSLLLLVLVFRNVDGREVAAAVARVRPATLALAVALALVGYAGRAWRWMWLLRRAGVEIPFSTSYRLTLVGTLYGLATPGRVGEFARALHLGVPRAQSLPSVLWDRLGDVILLEILALPAFVALDAWHGGLVAVYVGMVAVTAALVWALDDPRVLERLARAFPGAAGRIARVRSGTAGVLRSRAFVRGLVAGTFFYALNFAGAWMLLRDLAPASPAAVALVFPVIILLGNLPVAFGGLGLREQVAALAFARFGAAEATGPVFSLLWFAVITLLPGLVGALLAAAHRPRSPARRAARPEAPLRG